MSRTRPAPSPSPISSASATRRSAPGLAGFGGVKRRFTLTGSWNGVDIFDDYGHHPVEIAAVLKAARSVAGDGRVIAVVQPHRYTRLRDLFDGFCACFNDADTVIVAPVYAAGEAPIEGVDRDALVEGMRLRGHRDARALPDREALAGMVRGDRPARRLRSSASAPARSRQWAYALPGTGGAAARQRALPDRPQPTTSAARACGEGALPWLPKGRRASDARLGDSGLKPGLLCAGLRSPPQSADAWTQITLVPRTGWFRRRAASSCSSRPTRTTLPSSCRGSIRRCRSTSSASARTSSSATAAFPASSSACRPRASARRSREGETASGPARRFPTSASPPSPATKGSAASPSSTAFPAPSAARCA